MIRIAPASASTVLVISAGVAGMSLRNALLPEPMTSPSQIVSLPSTPRTGPAPSLTPAKLAAAVGKDPFHPERRRPAQRFRLPGEALPATADSGGAKLAFKLIGTAAMAEGKGFAMCQWGEQAPKLVRIGDTLGGLTLKRVEPGSALFLTAAGKRYEVQVPKAGS
jgi:hypothetical protein